MYLMGLGNGGGFTYYDDQLNYINNDQFGTCTIESLDPLTVTSICSTRVCNWSDGTPIDAADLIMYWGAVSTQFNDADSVIAPDGTTAVADADGLPVVLDPSGAPVPDADVPYEEDGSLPEGWTYQESAGVNFDAASEGLSLVTQFPEISDDGKAATITFDSFYVDYQTGGPVTQIGQLMPGARRGQERARRRGSGRRPSEALDRGVPRPATGAALKPIADFWNTGFDADRACRTSPDLYLSAGPYVLTSYDEVSQMTFEANPDYTWGPRPKVATIVYRIIGDPTAAVQALQNEEVDIVQPQSTADLLTRWKAWPIEASR